MQFLKYAPVASIIGRRVRELVPVTSGGAPCFDVADSWNGPIFWDRSESSLSGEGSLCPRGLCPREVYVYAWGVYVWGVLCPEGSLSRGSVSRGSLCPVTLSVPGGLCPGRPPPHTGGRVGSTHPTGMHSFYLGV